MTSWGDWKFREEKKNSEKLEIDNPRWVDSVLFYLASSFKHQKQMRCSEIIKIRKNILYFLVLLISANLLFLRIDESLVRTVNFDEKTENEFKISPRKSVPDL